MALEPKIKMHLLFFSFPFHNQKQAEHYDRVPVCGDNALEGMPDEGEDEGVGDGAGEPRALGVEVLRSLVQAASRHL